MAENDTPQTMQLDPLVVLHETRELQKVKDNAAKTVEDYLFGRVTALATFQRELMAANSGMGERMGEMQAELDALRADDSGASE